MAFGCHDPLYALSLCSLPRQVFGEGGGADGGGAVRAVPLGAPSHLCFHDAAVCSALHHTASAAQLGVSCCSVFVVLWAEGRVGGGSDGGDLWREVHGVHEEGQIQADSSFVLTDQCVRLACLLFFLLEGNVALRKMNLKSNVRLFV